MYSHNYIVDISSTQNADNDIPSTASIIELMQQKRKRPASASAGRPSTSTNAVGKPDGTAIKYFSAVWARPSKRKHKVWTNDGFVEIRGRFGQLRDIGGKLQGTTQLKSESVDQLDTGSRLHLGGNEAELVECLSAKPNYQQVVDDVAEAESSEECSEPESNSDKPNAADMNTNMLVDAPAVSKYDASDIEPRKKKKAQQSVFKPNLYIGPLK